MWHLLIANCKLVENFNQEVSTHCNDDNKEKLSLSIRSEDASNYWKSGLTPNHNVEPF